MQLALASPFQLGYESMTYSQLSATTQRVSGNLSRCTSSFVRRQYYMQACLVVPAILFRVRLGYTKGEMIVSDLPNV